MRRAGICSNFIVSTQRTVPCARLIMTNDDLRKGWDRFTSFGNVIINPPADLHVRNGLMGKGRILEENLEKHVYVMLAKEIKSRNEALLVTKRIEETVYVGAYFKEGIINQHIAEKVVESIVNSLSAYKDRKE